MLRRVRERKDHGPLIDPRDALDNLLSKRAANGAHADYGGGLDAFYGSHEVLGRRVLVRVRLLEIDKVLAGGLQQSVDVEHVDPRLRVLQRHALGNERRTQQVGKANSSRTGA